MILLRTSGNYAKNSFYFGQLSKFHGYEAVYVMKFRRCTAPKGLIRKISSLKPLCL